MREYRDYRLTVVLRSQLGTPMQSDTLFGHLCWQVRYAEGDAAVEAFLEPFLSREPPFVLSDAFPAGLLPKPLFPEVPVPVTTAVDYGSRKRREKAVYVRVVDFQEIRRGSGSDNEPVGVPWRKFDTPHAAINRHNWTTGGDGAFYHTYASALQANVEYPEGERQQLDVYVRSLPETAARVELLFRELSKLGFGRDKSVGTGQFDVVRFADFDGFRSIGDADGFVSLSTYVPARSNPTSGYWRTRVKRGYLGEMHAPDSRGENPDPFKRPMIQLEPGAVFQTEGPPKPFYGRMVKDIAPGFKKAVQCGYCLAVACKWPRT